MDELLTGWDWTYGNTRRRILDIGIEVAPPRTTNFGVLFVPTEGLYSEIVRNPVFFDWLETGGADYCRRSKYLSALLNSLSVGFTTLDIQKGADHQSRLLPVLRPSLVSLVAFWSKAQNTSTCLWQYWWIIKPSYPQLSGVRSVTLSCQGRVEPALDLLHFQENGKNMKDWSMKGRAVLRLLPNPISWPGQTRAGKNYLAFTFQDDSGEIEELWDT